MYDISGIPKYSRNDYKEIKPKLNTGKMNIKNSIPLSVEGKS
jgi:hypothetical protein